MGFRIRRRQRRAAIRGAIPRTKSKPIVRVGLTARVAAVPLASSSLARGFLSDHGICQSRQTVSADGDPFGELSLLASRLYLGGARLQSLPSPKEISPLEKYLSVPELRSTSRKLHLESVWTNQRRATSLIAGLDYFAK